MIVHLFMSDNVFVDSYIRFLNKGFNHDNHFVIVLGNTRRIRYPKNNMVGFFDIIRLLAKSDKIICHSISNPWFVIGMCLFKKLLKKTYWVVWGGDLHFYELVDTSIKYRVLEFFRKIFIRNIKGVCTLVDGDYDLFLKWYNSRALKYDALYAVDEALIKEIFIQNNKSTVNEKKRILLGNSATKSNKHTAMLKELYEKDIKFDELLCPLSYGDMRYADEVKSYGEYLFGNRFIVLDKFMKPKDYIEMLNSVDVAIMNNNRQQALGNIYMLAMLKKKIYLNPKSETYAQFVEKEGYQFYSVDDMGQGLFDVDDSALENNQMKMVYRNSFENQYNIWRVIFDA